MGRKEDFKDYGHGTRLRAEKHYSVQARTHETIIKEESNGGI